MNILISNDDGYDYFAIHELFRVLSKEHHVVMVAPDRERSGSSHGITLGKEIQFTEIEPHKFKCDGTPADCVLYSILGGVEFKPDLVIGGINRGPNLGSDLLYSGTAAVAREGAIYDIPAIAVSCLRHYPPFNYELEAELLLKQLPMLLSKCRPRTFININFPEQISAETPWHETVPALRKYSDRIEMKWDNPEHKSRHYLLKGEPIGLGEDQPQSDWYWIQRNEIVYSVVNVDV